MGDGSPVKLLTDAGDHNAMEESLIVADEADIPDDIY